VAIAHAVSNDSSRGSAGLAVVHNHDAPLIPRVAIPPTPARAATPTHVAAAKAHHLPPALRIVDTHGPCYVEVTRNGKLVTRTILRQGHQLAFRQHGLHVVLGNAGAVRLRINGHRAVRAGHSGQVRIFRVN